MGLQLVRITQEVVYNTYPTSPAAGTFAEIFLPENNAMSVRAAPEFWMIRDAGSGNRKVKESVGRTQVMGALSTYLFPSQTALLVGLGMGITGTAPCLDLPSFTIDHLLYLDGCATVYRRYTGNKFGDFSLSADSSAQGCLVSVKGQIIGSTPRAITATDFAPALSAYPADDPYLFYGAAGHLTIGAARTNFQSLTFDVKNMTQPFPDENIYNQRVGYFGRDISFGAKLLYKSGADRTAYEAGTKQAVSFELVSGSHSVTFDMQGQNNIDSLADDLPLDNYFTQTIGLSALVDLATGTDLVVTVT